MNEGPSKLMFITKDELDDLVTRVTENTLQKYIECRDKVEYLPLVLTKASTAKLLNLSKTTINRMIDKGTIEPVFIDGRCMVPRNEILKLLIKNT